MTSSSSLPSRLPTSGIRPPSSWYLYRVLRTRSGRLMSQLATRFSSCSCAEGSMAGLRMPKASRYLSVFSLVVYWASLNRLFSARWDSGALNGEAIGVRALRRDRLFRSVHIHIPTPMSNATSAPTAIPPIAPRLIWWGLVIGKLCKDGTCILDAVEEAEITALDVLEASKMLGTASSAVPCVLFWTLSDPLLM